MSEAGRDGLHVGGLCRRFGLGCTCLALSVPAFSGGRLTVRDGALRNQVALAVLIAARELIAIAEVIATIRVTVAEPVAVAELTGLTTVVVPIGAAISVVVQILAAVAIAVAQLTELTTVVIPVAIADGTAVAILILVTVAMVDRTAVVAPIAVLRTVNGSAHGLPEVRGPILLGRFAARVCGACSGLRDCVPYAMAGGASFLTRAGTRLGARCGGASSRGGTC